MTLIYVGDVVGGKPPQGLYPRRFVCDVLFVEGYRRARSLYAIEGGLVARARFGRVVRSIRGDVGEDRRLAWGRRLYG
jgi:hypothetical protein